MMKRTLTPIQLKKLEKNLKELDDNDSHGDRISRLHKEDGLPGGSGRIRDCAMKMLRRVSCCIAPLTAENLPEAITASEHETNHAPLTADAVRRIPGEFNSESPLSGYMARPHPNGTLFVRFAHASVVEYLADEKSKVGDFSPLALHSEAASLCFDFISKNQHQRSRPLCAIILLGCLLIWDFLITVVVIGLTIASMHL